jgi:hypothetical protein
MPITHPQQLNPQYLSRSLRRVLSEIATAGKAAPSGGGFEISFGNEFLLPDLLPKIPKLPSTRQDGLARRQG